MTSRQRTKLEIHTADSSPAVSESGGSPSPSPDGAADVIDTSKQFQGALGRLDDSVYASLLPAWRDKLRKVFLRQLEREMPVLERVQSSCRSKWRDVFFQQASLAGTHTFFMLWLPIWFWFGNSAVGRSLVYGLAAGAYMTGALKDLLCVPRPFAPPLTRLSVGNHAHEYGYPSTHSSNAVSMSLLVAEFAHSVPSLSSAARYSIYAGCTLFAFTIVFGRVYCGMHSITDVVTGVVLGLFFWTVHVKTAAAFDHFIITGGWRVAAYLIPLFATLIHFYPEPAEACLCYEDAVCFLSVVLGIVLARSIDTRDLDYSTPYADGRDLDELVRFCGAASAKLAIGIAGIVIFRIFAKAICHAILPPLFRYFSPFLVERRPYVPATKYKSYEAEETLQPVPSILNLPRLKEEAKEGKEGDSASGQSSALEDNASQQNATPRKSKRLAVKREQRSNGATRARRKKQPAVDFSAIPSDLLFAPKDADVLTKVVVYAGIGWIATNTLPALFYRLGLSV